MSSDPKNRGTFKAIPATALLVKATKETIMGSPLTIFVSHAVEALLTSHPLNIFQSVASPLMKSFC